MKMRTEKEITELIVHIRSDDRLSQPTATTAENAPLALVQLELETRLQTLEWVLGRFNYGGGSAGNPK